MDVDLAQGCIAHVGEAVGRPRWDCDAIPGFHFPSFVADYAAGTALLHDDDRVVVVPVQPDCATGRRGDEEDRGADAMLFPNELM